MTGPCACQCHAQHPDLHCLECAPAPMRKAAAFFARLPNPFRDYEGMPVPTPENGFTYAAPDPLHLTVEQVLAILPSLEREPSYPITVTEALNVAAREAELTTPQRMAAFLAQVAHESGEFRWLVEKGHSDYVRGCRLCADYRARGLRGHIAGFQYEGRADLGNTEPGDGVRYKGRGPIQLTGRANYRAAGKALGEPLEQQPELAARLDVGMRVAAWYWRTHHCNEPADAGDVVAVTRKVNGGTNGLEQRRAYYERAQRALEGKQ